MTFTGIDAAKFQRIQEKLQAQGILVASAKGSATAKGITVDWLFDPDAGTLEVNVDKRAWYDPSESTIEADLQQWIEGA